MQKDISINPKKHHDHYRGKHTHTDTHTQTKATLFSTFLKKNKIDLFVSKLRRMKNKKQKSKPIFRLIQKEIN